MAAVAAAGLARMLNSSEASTQNRPACEAEKAATKAEAADRSSAGLGGLRESATARSTSESEHAAPPQVASGLRPAASTSSIPEATPSTFAPLTAPDSAVAAASEETPAFLSSAGANVTTADDAIPWLAAATASSSRKARLSGPEATARTSLKVWESCFQKPRKTTGGGRGGGEGFSSAAAVEGGGGTESEVCSRDDEPAAAAAAAAASIALSRRLCALAAAAGDPGEGEEDESPPP